MTAGMNNIDRLRGLLDEHGFAPAVELGECMGPHLTEGDKFLVERIPAEKIDVGEIAVFEHGQTVFAHRVFGKIKVKDRLFLITGGEDQRAFDRPVAAANVLGKVAGLRMGVRPLNTGVIYLLLAVHYVTNRIRPGTYLYHLLSGFVGKVFYNGQVKTV